MVVADGKTAQIMEGQPGMDRLVIVVTAVHCRRQKSMGSRPSQKKRLSEHSNDLTKIARQIKTLLNKSCRAGSGRTASLIALYHYSSYCNNNSCTVIKCNWMLA